MDRNFHFGYTPAMIVNDMNRTIKVPTGKVVTKPKTKAKIINNKKPMFIRRTK